MLRRPLQALADLLIIWGEMAGEIELTTRLAGLAVKAQELSEVEVGAGVAGIELKRATKGITSQSIFSACETNLAEDVFERRAARGATNPLRDQIERLVKLSGVYLAAQAGYSRVNRDFAFSWQSGRAGSAGGQSRIGILGSGLCHHQTQKEV